MEEEANEIEEDQLNEDYLEFIKITRQHQAKRERQKKLQLKKHPHLAQDDYYIDVSQIDTVVVDNSVEAPNKEDHDSRLKQREEELVGLYGGREAYEKIRAMEMNIDDHFRRKCQELSPHYWPVIPINTKPYLNPIIN